MLFAMLARRRFFPIRAFAFFYELMPLSSEAPEADDVSFFSPFFRQASSFAQILLQLIDAAFRAAASFRLAD